MKSTILVSILAIAAATCQAAVSVSWFSFSSITSNSALGHSGSDTINLSVTSGLPVGFADMSYVVDGSFPYAPNVPVPAIGLRSPTGASVIGAYIFDFGSIADTTKLIFGLSSIDRSTGTLIVSAQNDLNQSIDVGAWTISGQYDYNGSSAWSGNTVSSVGNSLFLSSSLDTTADTKGIFFEGLPANLKSITIEHIYGGGGFDTVLFNAGIVPEPSSALLGAAAAGTLALRRRRARM